MKQTLSSIWTYVLSLEKKVNALVVGAGRGNLAITALTGDAVATGPGSAATTLAASGVTAGTYGDATHVSQVTVDAKGRVTSAVDVPITTGGTGDVVGPASATDNAIARYDGTTGKLLQDSGITIADGASGALSGTNSGDVTLAGSPNYLTIAGQVITRALIDLAAHVTGRMPYANLTAATAASKLLGRGSASGSGDWQEIALGAGLSMSGTTLSASATADTEYDAGNSGTALTIDWTNGKQQIVTLTGNVTFTLSNPSNGVAYRLILVQDGTGGRTVTWPSSVKWENNTAPVLTTTASKVIFVSLVKTAIGSGGYLGFATTNPITQP